MSLGEIPHVENYCSDFYSWHIRNIENPIDLFSFSLSNQMNLFTI